MIQIAFSAPFNRAFSKLIRKNKALEKKFWNKTETFIANPHHKSLKTHKLTGELKNLWSFSVEYDCRVIFYFETATKVVFINIGSHDEVY